MTGTLEMTCHLSDSVFLYHLSTPPPSPVCWLWSEGALTIQGQCWRREPIQEDASSARTSCRRPGIWPCRKAGSAGWTAGECIFASPVLYLFSGCPHWLTLSLNLSSEVWMFYKIILGSLCWLSLELQNTSWEALNSELTEMFGKDKFLTGVYCPMYYFHFYIWSKTSLWCRGFRCTAKRFQWYTRIFQSFSHLRECSPCAMQQVLAG